MRYACTQQIIIDLRDKINCLLSHTPQQECRTYTVQDDGELRRLEEEIRRLQEELRRRPSPSLEIVREAPQVVRISEPPVKEIRYEKDPYLVEQNRRLGKELEDALVDPGYAGGGTEGQARRGREDQRDYEVARAAQ